MCGFHEFGTPLCVGLKNSAHFCPGFKNSAHLCMWVSRIRHTSVCGFQEFGTHMCGFQEFLHTSVCGFQEFGTPLCVGFKKTEHFEYNEVLHLFVATIDLLITINDLSLKKKSFKETFFFLFFFFKFSFYACKHMWHKPRLHTNTKLMRTF